MELSDVSAFNFEYSLNDHTGMLHHEPLAVPLPPLLEAHQASDPTPPALSLRVENIPWRRQWDPQTLVDRRGAHQSQGALGVLVDG